MKAYAKINLALDVLDKRKDGYHNINSVMQKIDLFDELFFTRNQDVVVASEFKDDIVRRTALKLRTLFDVQSGVEIKIRKNIPAGAGLGGGSSDAAAALLALNKIWDLNLDSSQLTKIACELGADVPFFLKGNCSFVSGYGDKVEELHAAKMNILLVNPGYQLSTKEAYAQMDKVHKQRKSASIKMRKAGNIEEISSALHNDFIYIQKPIVRDMVGSLNGEGALNASITGKGPTVFGIFQDKEKLMQAYDNLKNKYPYVYATRTKWK